jgi:hypothetical protein
LAACSQIAMARVAIFGTYSLVRISLHLTPFSAVPSKAIIPVAAPYFSITAMESISSTHAIFELQ